jgi:hypothetical protein
MRDAREAGYSLVDIDALELQVRVAHVGTSAVDAVLVGEDFPELGTCTRSVGRAVSRVWVNVCARKSTHQLGYHIDRSAGGL